MAGTIVPAGRAYRTVLGSFATGVVVVTGIGPAPAGPTGLAISSFTSVSLDPPLVSFCVAHTSTTWPVLRTVDRLGINVLAADQHRVCAQFAASGGDKFGGCRWFASPGGAPILDGTIAWLDCSVRAEHGAGDHVIVVADVHHYARREGGRPLILFGGRPGSFRTA